MKLLNRRAAQAALVSALAAASLVIAPQSASAISEVPCNTDEYLHVEYHVQVDDFRIRDYHRCFALKGTVVIDHGGPAWVTKIWTGKNRAQWYGDGRWQPSIPIDRETLQHWPNHPGGVRLDAIHIL